MSYLKPILVTNCTETARVIIENHIGWITQDNSESIENQLNYLYAHPEEIKKVKKNMEKARENNLWIKRAEKVINDFNEIINEKK